MFGSRQVLWYLTSMSQSLWCIEVHLDVDVGKFHCRGPHLTQHQH